MTKSVRHSSPQILDELIVAGEMQESSKKSVLRVVTQSDAVEESENGEDVRGQSTVVDADRRRLRESAAGLAKRHTRHAVRIQSACKRRLPCYCRVYVQYVGRPRSWRQPASGTFGIGLGWCPGGSAQEARRMLVLSDANGWLVRWAPIVGAAS